MTDARDSGPEKANRQEPHGQQGNDEEPTDELANDEEANTKQEPHITLYSLLFQTKNKKKRKQAILSLIAIVAFIAVVTVARLLTAYEDFRSEVFSKPTVWWVVLLVLVNILVIGAVIAVLVAVLKPPRWYAYAFVVVLSFPVIVAAPIGVSTIAAVEVPGNPENVKLSDVYNPWESWILSGINKPVKKAKKEEIAALVDHYGSAGKPGKRDLLDRLDASMSSENLAEKDLDKLKKQIKTILNAKGSYKQRLRRVARELYTAGHRDAVQHLAAEPKTKKK